MPLQQSLRCDNHRPFGQLLSSEQAGLRRQTATLVVGEANSPVAELRAKHSVLFAQVLDWVFLPLIHPSATAMRRNRNEV
jgi:hypothetical protein